jgi:tetratricopeptide (TPR) repeat protein
VLRTALNALFAHRGYFTFRQGRGEEAYATLAPSAAFLRTSSEPVAAANSLLCLGIVCWILGRYSEAEESLQGSLTFALECGARWYEAVAGEFLGRVALEQGVYNQAQQYLGEALRILRQLGDPSMTAHSLSYLGRTMQILGEFNEAEKLLRESLELAREIGYRTAVGISLDGLGIVAYSQGIYEEAQAFFSESADMFREMGDPHRLSRTLNHQGFNSLSLDDTAKAQNEFNSALRMAYEGSFFPSALNALVGLAELEARQKPARGTFELVIFILQHPASTQETKNRAERLRVELNARLPHEEIEAAQQCAGLMSLDEIVRSFLTGV